MLEKISTHPSTPPPRSATEIRRRVSAMACVGARATALLSIVTVLSAIFASANTEAVAAAAPTTTYRVLSAQPANLDMRLPAQPHVLRVSPAVDVCRFGIFVIAPGATAAGLKSAADVAVAQSTLVAVDYAVDANHFCVVSAITLSAQTAAANVAPIARLSTAAVNDVGVYDGYHNAFATAHKSAYRDFGQGKFDESVDPITGRLSLTHMDVVIPGPNGLDIRVMRNYISPDPEQIVKSLNAGTSLEPQFNGFGWHVITNFGGIRGMMGACDVGTLTGASGATAVLDGYYMRAETLPQWINATGHAEPLVPVFLDGQSGVLPSTQFNWKTASGTAIDCGPNRAFPVAKLADGTTIEMNAVTNLGAPTVATFNAFPTKITDRWGNWLAFEYDMVYAASFMGVSQFSSYGAGHMAGAIPITRITSSDGREVRFIYASGAPGWTVGMPIPLTEKILKRVEYGTYRVEYSYDRLLDQGLNILAQSSPKYFLRRVDLPDGLNWGYEYLPLSNPQISHIVSPTAGQTLLSRLTYPNGGTASYSWGGSKMGGIPEPVSPFQLPKTFQLRTKTTSDQGVWRYSYTDMNRTAADEENDPIPTLDGRASGAGAVIPYTITIGTAGNVTVNLEAGRVTGPTGIEVFHHFPRYCDPTFSSFQNIPDNYRCTVATWRLGRLLQHATYPIGSVFSATQSAAAQITTQTYAPIDFPFVGFAFTPYKQVLPVLHAGCSDPRCPAGDAPEDPLRYLVRPVLTTVVRGANAYRTDRTAYLPECGQPTKVTETGQRNRSTTFVFDVAGYCQTTARQLSENGARVALTLTPLTANKLNVASETQLGPISTGGLFSSYVYFGTGEIAAKTDARGYTTYFDNYLRGTPQTEWHPVSAADGFTDPQRIGISRVVDDLGRIISETDGEGRTTAFAYNGLHKPTSIILPRVGSDQTVSFTYGATQDTMTRGAHTETVTYDGFGRVTAASNGLNTTTYGYDSAGRRTFVSYPATGLSSIGQIVAFDALNRPTQLTEPDPSNNALTANTGISYNDSAHSLTVTNPRGAATTMAMESFADPSEAWLKSRDSPEIGVMTFERNVFGQITKTSNNGIDRTSVFDAQQGYFLQSETHPELGTITYGRDNHGNLTSRQVGASGITRYAYDGQNRPTSVTPPAFPGNAPILINTWFKNGLLRSANAANITRSYLYDDSNNLSQEAISIEGTQRVLTYGYDTLDALASTTYPSGKTVSYAPDVIGRPTTATAVGAILVNAATYWPSGMLNTMSFGNTVSQAFTEQGARPLVNGLSIKRGSNPAALNLGYQYDPVANLTGVADSTNRGYARNISYDLFDRLRTDNNEAITYSGVGDISSKASSNGASSTFTYDASTTRLQSITGNVNRTFGYDVYGNAASDGRFNYQYDAFNSLRSAANGSATLASYDYDAHQHLAKKVSANQTTHYLYGKNGRLFAEYNLNTSASKEYVHLGNKLVGQIATIGVSAVTGCGFNVDATGNSDLASNGLILARYAQGLTGSALITGTRADQNPANLTTVINAINAHMTAYSGAHDIDASGGAISVNNAIIINRYLAGFRGNALTQGLSLTGTRTNANDIQTYIANGCPSSGIATATTTFLHPNVTGSPIMATDTSGEPAWFENYSAFGEHLKNEPSANISPTANQNWFIGKPVDSATGLVYFGGRWYDPQIARFLGFDPAPVDDANPHSFNRYAYGNNNPYKYLDPDGRQVVQIAQALARAAAPAAGVGDSVRAGGSAPVFDPATGIMANPSEAPSFGRLGGFLAAANAITAMFTPIAVIDKLAGIMMSKRAPQLEPDKQGKHIPGHNNFIPGRSEFTHPNPQSLLDKFAGSDQLIGTVPRGEPGSRERVDFGVPIGTVNGQSTTRGIIHNSKDGAHIVPSNPASE